MFVEVRVDVDLDRHDPCWAVVRVLRFLVFFTWLFPAPVFVCRTGKGLHLRALVVGDVDVEGLLRARAWLGDDFDRLALDVVRVRKVMFQKDVLFVARVKKYLRECPYGREVEVPIGEVSDLLDELLVRCAESRGVAVPSPWLCLGQRRRRGCRGFYRRR